MDTIKKLLITILIVSLFLTGCIDSIYDKGDKKILTQVSIIGIEDISVIDNGHIITFDNAEDIYVVGDEVYHLEMNRKFITIEFSYVVYHDYLNFWEIVGYQYENQT